jgi:hypothetical protein
LFTLPIADVVLDRHLLAAISIAGAVCDLMGGLFLAYDLLGGSHGPLRTLTRVVTYTLFFCLGYGLPFSLVIGPLKAIELALIVGLGLGAILGLEYAHALRDKARGLHHRYDGWMPFLFGALRGAAFGLAGAVLITPVFGLLFGILSAAGLVTVYAFQLSPTAAYQTNNRLKIRARELLASALRGLATALAGVLAALLSRSNAWAFGLIFGLVAGTVSALISIFSPSVEWWADQLPARRLGAFGALLFLLGVLLQSLQYWVVLFNVTVR